MIEDRDFAHWVGLLTPILQHSNSYTEEMHQIECIWAWFEVPEFWREPVRVMAQGAYYYGADEWMGQHT
jgi:hypothetical protein